MHSALDGGVLGGGTLGSDAVLGCYGCGSFRWRRCCSWQQSGTSCGGAALGVVVQLLAAVWPPTALVAVVGPLELGEAIPAGVVSRDKMVF